jgi:hypothetical protein
MHRTARFVMVLRESPERSLGGEGRTCAFSRTRGVADLGRGPPVPLCSVANVFDGGQHPKEWMHKDRRGDR